MINESKKYKQTKFQPSVKSNRRKIFVKSVALLLLAIFIIGNLPSIKTSAAGTITGLVFQDFNGNGVSDTTGGTADAPTAIDVGVGGVTVTAYDNTGTARGTTTSGATDGTYSLVVAPTSTGPYRLEFTTLPAGFQPSARNNNSLLGGGVGTTTQFVADGNTVNVNLAINRPEEYCQNNPNLVTCRLNAGSQDGNANPALQRFTYDAGTIYTDATVANYDAPAATTIAPASSIGSVYGLAYRRSTQRIYASAFYRRYVGFGPGENGIFNAAPSTTSDDSGAIYVVNPANGAVASTLTVPNATNNNHSNAAATDDTNASWDAVGKTSLGGIALSDDGTSLFVMNLQNKTLYELDPATGANLGSQAIPTGITGCPDADVRPFALKFYRGTLYAGMVCSAESTGLAANLRAYIYQVDPATLVFGTTPYTFSLNYNRGFNEPAQNNGNTTFPNEWRPWVTTIRSDQTTFVFGQPMLTDIEFDNGNLVLGIRDRLGDQGQDLGGAAGFRPAGEVLRACGSVTNFPTGFTLEANGRCGGIGTAPQNTGQGPGAAPGTLTGSGEYYFQDDYSRPANSVAFHDEVLSGGLLKIPGYGQTLTTTFDPIARTSITGDATFDQGVRWLDNATGESSKAYRLFDGDGLTSTGGEFGKANGLGDIISLCDSAPIEIGNRVWIDTNNNGVQDPQESRANATFTDLTGITVRLYNATTNALLATAITDQDGEYYFSSAPGTNTTNAIYGLAIAPNTAYQIRFDNAADFAVGGDLAGLVPTRANVTLQEGDDDASDSDAVRVTNPTGSPTAGTFPVITYTTGAAGANNHTLDAGFGAPVSIGSTVFQDPNNNGVFNTGEAGIGGVAVQLFYDADNNGAINGTEDDAPFATTTTSTVIGSVGNYFFGGLSPGNYQVVIPTAPTTFTVSSTTTATTDNQVENDDNGTQTLTGGSTFSPIISLTVNGEPSGNGTTGVENGQGGAQDDLTPNIDANGDMTVDFGFFAPASLGNFVFSDTNRDGLQTGELGISGVQVRLFNSLGAEIPVGPDGILGTADDANGGVTTGVTGAYLFQGLPPGTYNVNFNLPTGFGYRFTTANTGSDALDSDAVPAVGNPRSGTTGNYTLIAGQSDLTVDAGVVQTLSLGNQVFNDANSDGIRNAGEAGIVGVTVNLYAEGGTLPIATTTTVADGLYLFSGLAPGNYFVGVVTPVNFVSSTINGGDPDADVDDNDDNGVLTSGAETRSNAVTLSLTVAEPTGENPDNDTDTPDTSENLTVDFGFTPLYSIGNRVWFDTNNDGFINNVAGNVEVGINGVSVSLFASSDTAFANALQTVTTASGGYYRFDNLLAGGYVVRINPSNFADGAVLGGFRNTTGAGAANADVDSTVASSGEDGVNPTGAANAVQNLTTGGIVSNLVTLGLTAEPTGETDLLGGAGASQGTVDNQANMTIDFGFYRMNLSGTVWNDLNNNGTQGGTEPGVANITVRLYDSANAEIPVGPDGILGTGDDGIGGMLTAANGGYNFQGLPAGTYRVVVTSGSAVSSTSTTADPNGNADNDDNGLPGTGDFLNRTVSGTILLTPGIEVSFDNAGGLTSNPTVDFGFVLSPTVVKLDKFDAFSDGESVELKWSTGDEAGNLGFNVYREVNGKRQLLNHAPIAGNALRSSVQLNASGSDYTWTDKEFVTGAVYYLEDLDVNGSAELHGAVAPQSRQNLDNQPNAKTFSDLAKAGDSMSLNGLTETVTGAKVAVPNGKELNALTIRQQQIAAVGGAKFTVRHDGWYRVTAQQLAAAGFDVKSNSQLWQLYADGAEVPFKLNSDSIEFFGRGLDTPLTDKRAYYLVNGQTNGLRINAVEGGSAGENADANSFGVTVERKDRAVYVSTILNGDNDNWFGAAITRSSQTVQTLNAVNVAGGQAHLSVKLQGVVASEHAVSVRFNEMELGTVEFSGFENKQFEFDLPAAAMREGINRVYLQSTGGGNDASLVDSIRLSYQRGYTTDNNRLRFTVPAAQTARVNGFTDANISVYEIRNGAAAQQVVVKVENSENGNGFSLGATTYDREFIAVADSTVEQSSVTRNIPSTWNNAANGANFVIVTSDELRESAGRLAKMREAQGLKTHVVAVEDIFDEFSFGRRDPNAIKSFLKTATTKWQLEPQYALLFGDSSYDTRNNLNLSVTRDHVPTKSVDTEAMETSSDSWLADFNNDGAEDIALGRLPVGNATEAAAAVEKLARFDAQGARAENTNVLVADSGFENYSETLQTLLPNGINAVRIDRAAMTDAETHQKIVERLNANPLLVTYTGHGSQSVWATNNIFRSEDAAQLANNQLSFYLLMNCLNGYNHQPTGESLGEALFRSTNGAVAVWTSSGITQPDKQAAISQAFTRFAFSGSGRTIRLGDVVKAAKQASNDSDVRRTWQLIGDPTISVK